MICLLSQNLLVDTWGMFQESCEGEKTMVRDLVATRKQLYFHRSW
jgi:hypothetical protein